MRYILFCIAIVFASATYVEAKTKKIIIYRKNTKLKFSDAVIEGQVRNPEGVYVVPPPPAKSPDLLRLRQNFHKELMRDTLLLK